MGTLVWHTNCMVVPCGCMFIVQLRVELKEEEEEEDCCKGIKFSANTNSLHDTVNYCHPQVLR